MAQWCNCKTVKVKTEVLVHLVNVKLCEVQNSGLVWKSKKDLIHFCQDFSSPDHTFPVIRLFLSSCCLSEFCSLNQRSAVLLLLPCRTFVVVPFYLHVSSTLLCEQVQSDSTESLTLANTSPKLSFVPRPNSLTCILNNSTKLLFTTLLRWNFRKVLIWHDSVTPRWAAMSHQVNIRFIPGGWFGGGGSSLITVQEGAWWRFVAHKYWLRNVYWLIYVVMHVHIFSVHLFTLWLYLFVVHSRGF